jgi:hypothetical protein
MRRWSPVWIAGIVAVVLAIGAIVWGLRGAARLGPVVESPGNLPLPPGPRAKAGQLPRNLEFSGPDLTQRDDQGNPVWSARSKGSFRFDAPSRRITGTDIVWELKRGTQHARIAARRMEVAVATGEVLFADGLTLSAGPGQTFALKQARVEPGTWKVIGEGSVRWVWGRFRVSADSLVVDAVRKRVRLRGDVHLSAQ